MQKASFYSYTQKKADLLIKNLLVIKRDGRVVKFDPDKKLYLKYLVKNIV